MAGNKPGSGFYAGATNETLIGEIQKITKETLGYVRSGTRAIINSGS